MPYKTMDAIRLENARSLAALEGSLSNFARRMRRSRQQVSNFLGRNPQRMIGNELAREIERVFGKEPGWLDQGQDKPAAAGPAAGLSFSVIGVLQVDGSMKKRLSQLEDGAQLALVSIGRPAP